METMQKRVSVPMTRADLHDLATIRRAPDALRAIGVEASASDAALLHHLVRRQLDAFVEEASALGYAQLAQDLEWVERSVQSRSRRRGGDE